MAYRDSILATSQLKLNHGYFVLAIAPHQQRIFFLRSRHSEIGRRKHMLHMRAHLSGSCELVAVLAI